MTTDKGKITVIIPIYNVEAFLRRCLNSVLAQTYQNLEILLIDDGSTDSSANIAKEYEKKDPRIRLIRQENKGLSGARNTGIENATSENIAFVDSDDEIMPTMFEELMDALISTGADIVQCDICKIGMQDEEEFSKSHINQIKSRDLAYKKWKIFEYERNKKFDELWKHSLQTVVQWNKLYKRHIFETLRYPEGKTHEDEFVIHEEINNADKLAYIEKQLYIYYVNRKGAITNRHDYEKACHVLEAWCGRLKFFADSEEYLYAKKTLRNIKKYYLATIQGLNGTAGGEWKKRFDEQYKKTIKEYKYMHRYIPLRHRFKDWFNLEWFKLYLVKERILHGGKQS